VTAAWLAGRSDEDDPSAMKPMRAYRADPDAPYVARYPIALDKLEPQVAKPFSPDNVVGVSELSGMPLDGLFIGACTTTEEELVLGALVLEAAEKKNAGKSRRPPQAKQLVVPGDLSIQENLRHAGLWEVYERNGFRVGPPGCSMCLGVASEKAGRGEKWLSSQNRNYENRMGEGSLAHLASAATVAASAAEMKVTDPRPLLAMVDQVADSDANVLITGENGTGKGVVARALHSVSVRAGKPLVVVNMGGLSEGVFESELFGHVKGAFTDAKTDRAGRFELADGGTLFMDEIANIPLNQQTKLLRVLETGEFERVGSSKTRRGNVRFISATNADVHAEVAAGRFRRDLLFRLNTVEIHLPPLRERREDIPPLAAHFLRLHARRYRKNVTAYEPAAMRFLQEHGWPGNVRELDHAIERAVLMAQGNLVKASDLALRAGGEIPSRLDEMSLEEVERHLIKKTLARCDGNAMKAAEALGLSRSAFYRRLEKYGL